MRLFAALELPGPVKAHLLAAVGDAAAIPAERWHLTLAFYGEVGAGRVGGLAARLERAARRGVPLRLQLAGSGVFGRAPRAVVWCGVAGDLDPLTRLARAAVAAGRREGVPPERRPFRPHVTLGRLPPQAARRVAAVLTDYTGPEWTGGQLVLVHSRLGAQVVYDVIARFGLGDAAG